MPRAVFFDSGRCKAAVVWLVLPITMPRAVFFDSGRCTAAVVWLVLPVTTPRAVFFRQRQVQGLLWYGWFCQLRRLALCFFDSGRCKAAVVWLVLPIYDASRCVFSTAAGARLLWYGWFLPVTMPRAVFFRQRQVQGCCGMAGFAGYDAPRAVFFRHRQVQGCCGMAGFAGYDARRAVFFDSGRCKAGFVFAVFPFGRQAQDFGFMVLWDLKDIFHSVEVPQVQFLDKFDVPGCSSETGMHSLTVQRPSRSHRFSSCAWLHSRCGQRWV